MADSMPQSVRRDLISKIHVAKKDLKLGEQQYRSLLSAVTGKDSSKDMSITELNAVMAKLRELGFVVKVSGRRDTSGDDPRLKRIWALWFALRDQGKCNGSARSLNGLIKRQTGVEKMEWLSTNKDFDAVIHALKAMQQREKSGGTSAKAKGGSTGDPF